MLKKITLFFISLSIIGAITTTQLFADEVHEAQNHEIQTEEVHHDEKGEDLPFWTVIPFVLILLCIAILPIVPATAHWWEENNNKLIISAVLGAIAFYILFSTGWSGKIWHTIIFEYIPFIFLLGSLFYVSGGIVLKGDIEATPLNNSLFLLVGASIASFVGTTGASMLLIRPLLKTNSERKHVVHTVIFFIFLVSNIGGSLTPLGDPPLFLGYLQGVPFTWTFGLFPEMLLAVLILVCFVMVVLFLLVVYSILDLILSISIPKIDYNSSLYST